jgi:DNA polymerase elongation subunit (family B)
MYSTIAIEHNISFETVNCQCCQNDPQPQVSSEVMDDSIFVKNRSIETINDLILYTNKIIRPIYVFLLVSIDCKEKYHVVLEHKNRYMNTIIFDKKNRFVAWTGKSPDKPILKNLDGMSGRYPKWIKQNIAKIASYIVTTDDHRSIESLIDQAFHELESGKVSPDDLAFIAKLSKEPEEYKNENDRMRILAMTKRIRATQYPGMRHYLNLGDKSTYYIKPENLNLEKYKRILLSKLNEILEIIAFDTDCLKSQLLYHNQRICHKN